MQPQPPTHNPYAPPQAHYGAYPASPPGYLPPPPRIEGDRVTIHKTYAFPPLCVKCGATGELRGRSQPFAWFTPWTYFLLLAGLLPMVVVQMVLTKKATLLLPLCPPCASGWTTARLVRTLAFVVPIVGGLGLAIAGLALDSGIVAACGGLLFFPGILAVIPVDLILVRRRTLRAVFVDDHVVTLKGIAPQVIEVIGRPPSG